MRQLEFKFCRQCGEAINDMLCYKCGALNYKIQQTTQISEAYKQVITEQVEALGYNAFISSDNTTLIIDEVSEEELNIFGEFEIEVYLIEDINTIDKLNDFLIYLGEKDV